MNTQGPTPWQQRILKLGLSILVLAIALQLLVRVISSGWPVLLSIVLVIVSAYALIVLHNRKGGW